MSRSIDLPFTVTVGGRAGISQLRPLQDKGWVTVDGSAVTFNSADGLILRMDNTPQHGLVTHALLTLFHDGVPVCLYSTQCGFQRVFMKAPRRPKEPKGDDEKDASPTPSQLGAIKEIVVKQEAPAPRKRPRRGKAAQQASALSDTELDAETLHQFQTVP